jgi:hypothetical protein
MDMKKIALGAALLLASSAILMATGTLQGTSLLMLLLAAAASLGMAAGALLVGTAGTERPV